MDLSRYCVRGQLAAGMAVVLLPVEEYLKPHSQA